MTRRPGVLFHESLGKSILFGGDISIKKKFSGGRGPHALDLGHRMEKKNEFKKTERARQISAAIKQWKTQRMPISIANQGKRRD